MGLFHRKKKKNETEENKEFNEAAGIKTESELVLSEDNHKEYIRSACESISRAKGEILAAKEEYSEVNNYLNDTEMIEDLPDDKGAELKETADHMLSLKIDLDSLDKKKANISQFQYQSIMRYEDEIPKGIEKMKKDENYLNLIKGDLMKLSDEHEKISRDTKEENERRHFLRRFSVFASAVIIVMLIVYFTLYVVYEIDLTNAFIFTIGGAMLMIIYLFFESEQNKKAIQLNAAKMKKLVNLTNTVKIKYVNQANAVDFVRDKYNVNSADELEYLWGEYVQMKDDEGKKRKTSATYDFYSSKLTDILKEARINDPDIWLYQVNAIVDHKEMVEIRHRLNVRRQKIRETIELNTKLIEAETAKIHKFRSDFPDEKGLVNTMMDTYRILV